jgi:hypothetical protein
VWLLEGPTPILYMSFMVFMAAKIRHIIAPWEKNQNFSQKMFGGLKNVVFLQPQIERFSVAK